MTQTFAFLVVAVTVSACESDDASSAPAEAGTGGNVSAGDGSAAGVQASGDASTGLDSAFDADAVAAEPGDASGVGGNAVWGASCNDDVGCAPPTDFCVKQPGASSGYCSQKCVNNAACADAGAPAEWTCNTIQFAGCEDVATNWCGPISELEMFPGVIIECP